MLGMSLDTAKNIAIVSVSVLIALAVASIWIMKTAAQKLAVIAILLLLAALAWSQRSALDDCADRVREAVAVASSTGTIDTTCTFFGQDVTIDAPDRA